MNDATQPTAPRQWSADVRRQAGEFYYLHGITDLDELCEMTGVPEGTLRRWRADDHWIKDYEEQISFSYAKTRENLLFVIFQMSRQLRLSATPRTPDEDYILPDLNLELRINRLTLAVERIAALGNFIPTKQKIDIIKEIKEHAYECVDRKIFTEQQVLTAFHVIEHYMDALDINTGKKA